uniref:hypothetical protein n=1 Tax=uncultured Paracoccus sp. TaxID=189685 RepID=UPI002600EAFD
HDQLGDALMPKIAPLNTDAEHVVSRTSRPGAPNQAPTTSVTGTLTPLTTPVTGLRPSARLGLSIGLPGGDLIRNLPLGYGINRTSMAPASADFAQVSGLLRFYAGRMRIVEPENGNLATTVVNDVIIALEAEDPSWAALGAQVSVPENEVPATITVLGQDLILKKSGSTDPLTLTEPQEEQLRAAVDAELQNYIHWIPYAFGPVPVRVTGDIISQTPHGLFGVIDVVPRHWKLPGDGDRRAADSVPKEFGAPVRYTDVVMDPHEDAGERVNISEFVIFYQDGLTHHDAESTISWQWDKGADRGPIPKIAPDCHVCDDSYDWGDQGVSYRSRPFASMLRWDDIVFQQGTAGVKGAGRIEASDDLNAVTFPPDFFNRHLTSFNRHLTSPDRAPLTLMACPGDQVLIRVVHPGGRARQRAFVMNGLGYDDLFPGFGFPNAALVAPGKVVSAWLHPRQVLGQDGQRQDMRGKVLWHDGPNHLMAGGTWGLVDFNDKACLKAAQ